MPVSLDDARRIAEELTRPGRFLLAAGLALEQRRLPAEALRWEVFQGRLLPPEHTRQEATFESWNVHLLPADAPLLSLKLSAAGALHVVRGVDSFVAEGYDAGGGVYLTREARRWVLELVASFDLARFGDPAHLRDEADAALGRAVTGARLPLSSVEAPHPLFSFGQLFAPTDRPEPHRLLEAHLRGVPGAREPVDHDITDLLWAMFQDISLSPWTGVVAEVLRLLAGLPDETALDFEARLLRLVGRHLTAYDLVTFHHRGANYPDALLLDALLGDYLARLERDPALFAANRPRRRALRQAWAVRRHYEGHAVPDVPTSPGEHARAYPGDHPRIPEEQLLHSGKRRRRLFADAPLTARLTPAVRAALEASLADLAHADERRELGAAVYLDRPFGGAKAPVEPDGTPLLASLAYSRSIAARRLALLTSDLGLSPPAIDLTLPGVPLEAIGPPVRPTALGLADAARAAADFVFVQTLRGSVELLLRLFDFTPLGPAEWLIAGPVLLARPARGEGLVAYDAGWAPRLRLVPRLEAGYASRRGLEWPAGGLMVTGPDGAAEEMHLPAR